MLAEFVRRTDIDLVHASPGATRCSSRARSTTCCPPRAERGVDVVAAAVYNSGLLSRAASGRGRDVRLRARAARTSVARVAASRRSCEAARRDPARRGDPVPPAAPAGRRRSCSACAARRRWPRPSAARPPRCRTPSGRRLVDAGLLDPREGAAMTRITGIRDPRRPLPDVAVAGRLRRDEQGRRLLGRLRHPDDRRARRSPGYGFTFTIGRGNDLCVARGRAARAARSSAATSTSSSATSAAIYRELAARLPAALARPGEGRRAPRDGRRHERGLGPRGPRAPASRCGGCSPT